MNNQIFIEQGWGGLPYIESGCPVYCGPNSATLPVVVVPSDRRITNPPWDMFVQSMKYKMQKDKEFRIKMPKSKSAELETTLGHVSLM